MGHNYPGICFKFSIPTEKGKEMSLYGVYSVYETLCWVFYLGNQNLLSIYYEADIVLGAGNKPHMKPSLVEMMCCFIYPTQ